MRTYCRYLDDEPCTCTPDDLCPACDPPEPDYEAWVAYREAHEQFTADVIDSAGFAW